MNPLILAASAACVACAAPVFAQSTAAAPSDVLQQPATSYPSAAIAQNFQYINHPPPPLAPASSVKPSGGGGRGGRHRQMSSDSDSSG
ncbi:hypothetical protein [Paraburkholderia susongensis]|uniref:Uncharacterized protein n=1 Tax=Paraburkholderia susongensis TaxID=1515439 RepID=A0A1X7M6B0_9BURK|nr:hypothetical protein [Paraburkholderia susongensis]SMG60929.1 hypothetical protein SAMN06265784_11877 [Paraburkholderia susongensis]